MKICEYAEYREEEIMNLYAAVGWTNYTDRPEMLRKAYAHSLLTLAAYEGERLLGLLRAVGDGFSAVLIQDLLVLPECQRQGIGSALLREALGRFREVYQIELLTDNTPKTIAFYESLGLVNAADCGCCAFVRIT